MIYRGLLVRKRSYLCRVSQDSTLEIARHQTTELEGEACEACLVLEDTERVNLLLISIPTL